MGKVARAQLGYYNFGSRVQEHTQLIRSSDVEQTWRWAKKVLEMVKRTTSVADKGDSTSVLLVPDAAPEVCSGFD